MEEITVKFVRDLDAETAKRFREGMRDAPVMVMMAEEQLSCDGCQCPEQMCETCRRHYEDKYVGGEA